MNFKLALLVAFTYIIIQNLKLVKSPLILFMIALRLQLFFPTTMLKRNVDAIIAKNLGNNQK